MGFAKSIRRHATLWRFAEKREWNSLSWWTDWHTVSSASPLEFTHIRTGKAISWQRAIVRDLLTCLWLLMKWVDILRLTQFQTNLSKRTQLWWKTGWICIALAWTRGKVVTQRSKHINSWRSILIELSIMTEDQNLGIILKARARDLELSVFTYGHVYSEPLVQNIEERLRLNELNKYHCLFQTLLKNEIKSQNQSVKKMVKFFKMS